MILARLFKPEHIGDYIDVGAADPDFLSVTKWFYSQGWSGLNIEPNMRLYQRLVASRPRDINLNFRAGDQSATLRFTERKEAELSSFYDAPLPGDVSDERLGRKMRYERLGGRDEIDGGTVAISRLDKGFVDMFGVHLHVREIRNLDFGHIDRAPFCWAR